MEKKDKKKVITIGRATDNDIPSQFEDVSENHAEIRLEGKSVVIEDLNSTNGTFVNGFRIKKQVLQPSDEVLLGKHKLPLEGIFNRFSKVVDFNDYTEEFDNLKIVYDEHLAETERIMRASQKKMAVGKLFMISLPVVLFAFVGRGFFGEKLYLPLYIALNSILSAVALFVIHDASKEEKLKQARIEFKRKYRCPKCQKYQLYKEWELHRDEEQCPHCKAMWSKKYIPKF